MALAQVLVSRLGSLPRSHRAALQDDASSIISEGMYSRRVPSLDASMLRHARSTDATTSLGASSMSSSYDARSCHSEPATSFSQASSSLPRPRHNEHLAVLLQKRLWKPDSQASHCDTFICRKAFSIWERRHHCRKCGGVFCAECTSRTTALLDTSKLSFLHPPRNVPIFLYNSPDSPVLDARVCDECWDQIHGCKSPRSPVISKLSNPIALVRDTESSTGSGSSSVSSSISTPPDGSPLSALASRPALRRTPTSPRIAASPLRSTTPVPQSITVSVAHISDSELSLGELDSYPLKRASSVCKANGGGRWEPKPIPEYVAKRIPGCKPAYELEIEQEAEERRRRRANPVIKDGGA
ncbi:Zinc finger FYVE domain-containing protein 16 [Trametes pubescens]|uniref:Zinc finger FYVE domain-containing protein 16 n=1 Tax=Trametes pubescens TaxID=154538 RepID=A0A1M2VBL3_TRAPU|nr:Zinc finger FYVE domain-containing protein 16 [Trametes pubescens]